MRIHISAFWFSCWDKKQIWHLRPKKCKHNLRGICRSWKWFQWFIYILLSVHFELWNSKRKGLFLFFCSCLKVAAKDLVSICCKLNLISLLLRCHQALHPLKVRCNFQWRARLTLQVHSWSCRSLISFFTWLMFWFWCRLTNEARLIICLKKL